MKNKICILDEDTSSKIAAGEVIERPVSVVKELVENAMDADSNRIVIKIESGGLERIQIIDNGRGMDAQNLKLCLERHATSKIRSIEDLHTLETMGFRGEALASIAAISRIEIISRPPENTEGYSLLATGGQKESLVEVGCPSGTSITVDELFYNVPARKKFMKSAVAEMGKITELIEKLALARPDIAFTLYNGDKIVFRSPGGGDLYKAAQAVYGTEACKKLLALEWTERVLLLGLISLPELNRSSRNYYSFFVNNRWIKSQQLAQIVDEAYHTLLPQSRFPLVILHLQIDPALIDVNVHPAKMEIKFSNFESIKEVLLKAFKEALVKQNRMIPRLICGKPNILNPLPHMDEAFRLDEKKYSILTDLDEIDGTWSDDEQPYYVFSEQMQKEKIAQKLGMLNFHEGKDNRNLPSTQHDQPLKQEVENDAAKVSNIEKAEQNKLFLPEDMKEVPRPFLFSSLHPLGQFSATYIIATGENMLYLIDQHAAHERIRYEQYKHQFYADKGKKTSNLLAIPIPLELTGMEKSLLLQNIVTITDWGWIVEDFGDNTCLLRGTPVWLAEGDDAVAVLLSLLDDEDKNDKQLNETKLFRKACRSAVKGHDYLTHSDIIFLFQELDKAENPYSCPHGRPTVTSISLAEIEKKFYRSGI